MMFPLQTCTIEALDGDGRSMQWGSIYRKWVILISTPLHSTRAHGMMQDLWACHAHVKYQLFHAFLLNAQPKEAKEDLGTTQPAYVKARFPSHEKRFQTSKMAPSRKHLRKLVIINCSGIGSHLGLSIHQEQATCNYWDFKVWNGDSGPWALDGHTLIKWFYAFMALWCMKSYSILLQLRVSC